VLGRTALLGALRTRPWEASESEAGAMKAGFAQAEGFWAMLMLAIVADVPTGLGRIDCPVVLAQGMGDVVASGQTARYLLMVPGSTFRPLPGAGHAPQSDSPEEIVRMVRTVVAEARAARPDLAAATPAA
jgi:pimeloyl-ACP methyl ester carboxylesterase